MRTLTLYDPKIYSIFIFSLRESKEKELQGSLKRILDKDPALRGDISMKEGMAVLEVMMDIVPGSKGPVEISPDLLKIKTGEMAQKKKKVTETLTPFLKEGSRIHNYTLYTCGSNNRTWLRTYSNISFLYQEKKENNLDILQTNISYLNRILNRTGEVIVNSITHGKISGALYILGRAQGRKSKKFLKDMVIELEMGDVREKSLYGESPIEVSPSTPHGAENIEDNKSYQIRQQ